MRKVKLKGKGGGGWWFFFFFFFFFAATDFHLRSVLGLFSFLLLRFVVFFFFFHLLKTAWFYVEGPVLMERSGVILKVVGVCFINGRDNGWVSFDSRDRISGWPIILIPCGYVVNCLPGSSRFRNG